MHVFQNASGFAVTMKPDQAQLGQAYTIFFDGARLLGAEAVVATSPTKARKAWLFASLQAPEKRPISFIKPKECGAKHYSWGLVKSQIRRPQFRQLPLLVIP